MAKYVAAVDHKAGYEKSWTYIQLENTDKSFAFAEAAVKGFQKPEAFCVVVLKQVKKHEFTQLVRIYPSGNIEDIRNQYGDKNWTIFNNEIEK